MNFTGNPYWTGGRNFGSSVRQKGFIVREEQSVEKVLNFVMRGILGTIAIYFINAVLEKMGFSLGVGINAATVLTSGILGFPGLMALYGIGFYKLL